MFSSRFSFLGGDQSAVFDCIVSNEAELRQCFMKASTCFHVLEDICLSMNCDIIDKRCDSVSLGYYFGIPGRAVVSLNYFHLLDSGFHDDELLYLPVCTETYAIPKRFFHPMEDVIKLSCQLVKTGRLPSELKWESWIEHAFDWPSSSVVPKFGEDYESHVFPPDLPRIKRF
jgi:hypothetical protein